VGFLGQDAATLGFLGGVLAAEAGSSVKEGGFFVEKAAFLA
jgi:hypothetical protein